MIAILVTVRVEPMLKTISAVLFIFFVAICCRGIDGRPQQLKPGCWYEGRRYQEVDVVNTTEPCLRCRCNEGSLRCRLRVCPKLPSPPPLGCKIRAPEDNACCAELVCGDSHEKNVTARRDTAEDTIRLQHDVPTSGSRDTESSSREYPLSAVKTSGASSSKTAPRWFSCSSSRCLHEGVRYAPGSGMMGSRRCEYCYCISGSRRCLRPRCLLPLAGCTPLYAPYSCCPVAYNCTHSASDATNLGASSFVSGNGCRVGNRRYDEGEMVRDVEWKATCDNCFCAMGGIRCVPLSCAPPLQGCTPIVREGHCCPSTYNCSGSIAVKATENYGSYAFISKDYAKFRKETNFFSMDVDEEADDTVGNSTIEGRGHKNSLESLKTLMDLTTIKSTNNTNKLINDETSPNVKTSMTRKTVKLPTNLDKITTTVKPIISSEEIETMDNEIPTETMDYDGKSSTLQQETTFGIGWTTNEPTEIPTISTTDSTTNFDAPSTIGTTFIREETLDSMNSLLSTQDSVETTNVPETSTSHFDEESTMRYSNIEDLTTIYEGSNLESSTFSLPEGKNTVKDVDNKNSDKGGADKIIEHTTEALKLFNSTQGSLEDIQEILDTHDGEEQSVISVKGPATGSPTTILMPDNILVMNVTLKTNVSVGHVQGLTISPVRSIPPDIEAILNITHRKKGEDYDYDYSQPTLPPSLPNVRIIPFVAADALVKTDKEIPPPVTNYPLGSVGVPPQEIRPTVAADTVANFYDIVTQENRFSPPIETEGGFVPREPPYFDPSYHSTDLNLEIRTGVTVLPADITNPHRKNDELASNCNFEDQEYHHGALLPSSGHCIICICYYGEVVCSDEKCPPLKIGCRRLEDDNVCCGKIVCVDAEESPTVVLDRADAISASPRQPIPSMDGVVSPDPFRDVIKTEPAPDLPSLIEDMIPYLVEHRITTPSSPTTPINVSTLESSVQSHFELRPDQNFPVEPNIPNISLINDVTGNKSPGLDETFGSINRTVNKENYPRSTSTRSSIVENSSELTTTGTEKRTLETSESSPTTSETDNENLKKVSFTSNNEEDSSLFSFGSVLDLFFSDNTDNNRRTVTEGPKNEETTKRIGEDIVEETSLGFIPVAIVDTDEHKVETPIPSSRISPIESSWTTATAKTITWIRVDEPSTKKTMPTTTMGRGSDSGLGTTSSSDNNEIGTSVSGLLKLAGCNIYGRMYRVGRIITELSSPCLECRCTEIGVQCKELKC